MKPMQRPPRGEREVNFFSNIFPQGKVCNKASKSLPAQTTLSQPADALHARLVPLVPRFYGVKSVSIRGKSIPELS